MATIKSIIICPLKTQANRLLLLNSTCLQTINNQVIALCVPEFHLANLPRPESVVGADGGDAAPLRPVAGAAPAAHTPRFAVPDRRRGRGRAAAHAPLALDAGPSGLDGAHSQADAALQWPPPTPAALAVQDGRPQPAPWHARPYAPSTAGIFTC